MRTQGNISDNFIVAMCDCGEPIIADLSRNPGATESEYNHFVWAVRSDGTRSNLGYCPRKLGMPEARRRARTAFMTGRFEYHGDQQ